jgi:Flp pilus assembly pilin Flp
MNFKLARQRGQGMTEYIIIVALIAIGAIVAVQLFGQQVRTQMASMTAELGGQANQSLQQLGANAQGASTEGTTAKTLSTYGAGGGGGGGAGGG